MFQPVRIGVIGLGNFGRLHARTLLNLGEAHLAALVDSNPKAVEAIQSDFPGIPVWTDLRQAIEQSDAEAWIVASSTSTHAAVAKTLLLAGLPILVEKPISHNLSAAADLAALVTTDSSNLMLGHIVLFNSEFRQLRDEIAQRGAPAYIDCVRHRPANLLHLMPDDNPFHLLMVHDLYCVLALMQRAEPQAFFARKHLHAGGACDLGLAQLRWANGTLASFAASFLTPVGMPEDGFDRIEVFGNGWAARMNPNPRPLHIWDDRARWPINLEIRTATDGASGMLAEELRCFCRVVRGQQSVPLGATYSDAMQVERWLDRLESAANVSESQMGESC